MRATKEQITEAQKAIHQGRIQDAQQILEGLEGPQHVGVESVIKKLPAFGRAKNLLVDSLEAAKGFSDNANEEI